MPPPSQYVERRISQARRGIPRTALIYAEPLLAPTMTFVRSQALALKEFAPIFAGASRLRNGLSLPEDRVVTIQGHRKIPRLAGKLREVPLKVFGYDPLFFRRVGQFDPTLVHAHFGPAALTILPLARWLNVPLIATFHGFDATASDKHFLHSNFRARAYVRHKAELWQGADLFIAVSKFVRDRLVQQGFPEKKIVVHYIGVDTNVFTPDPGVTREPIVLFTASLHEGKGCEYVIRAMERVQPIMPEVELVVIGDGPLRPKLEQLAASLLKRHRFLGLQPPESVRAWMNRAKVFSVASVRASSGATEAFGLVYTEAQAMGLPVTSFSSGGVPEAVAHGKTGLLAQEGDWHGLAQNILHLLQDGPFRRRMGEAAQKRVREEFDLYAQTRKLERIYESVLSNHKQETVA